MASSARMLGQGYRTPSPQCCLIITCRCAAGTLDTTRLHDAPSLTPLFDPPLQVCRKNPGEKGKYIKNILALLQSTSAAVVYECAVTLVSLSQVCIRIM